MSTLDSHTSSPMVEQSWAPPTQFEEYKVIRPLGRGGMGHVYLGHDLLLDRPVAIKFIGRSNPDAIARQRFIIEGRAIARLQHPNVVSVYRVGEVEGHPYLVSELIRGRSLEELETPMASHEAIRIGLALARGLDAAHRRGVLHRDIKPANAMVTQDGEVKLLDFGLAKLFDLAGVESAEATMRAAPSSDDVDVMAATGALTATPPLATPTDRTVLPDPDGVATKSFVTPTPMPRPSATPTPVPGEADLTRDGVVLGTPHYMAPELWRGEPATARSDVYAIGGVLFKLLTGRPPHRAATIQELWSRVLAEEAPRVDRVVENVDERFADIVERCLRRDPAARFADASEVRHALDQLTAEPRKLPLPSGNPYRGLSPFEAEHRSMYFGREHEIGSVVERLRSEPLVVVAGVSGTGKSSLLRAGVIPTVLEGSLGDGRSWSAITIIPGRRPLVALATALAPQTSEIATDEALFDSSPSLIRDLRNGLGDANGLLLFIDQLEELVTLSDEREAKAVAELIARATSARPGAIRIVATARADFLGQLAALPGLGEQLDRALHLLRPMSREGIRDAIVGPARAMGVAFETEELVQLLVDETARDLASLPLLQFALSELWEARDIERARITTAAFEMIGGVAGALVKHADGVIGRLLPEQRIVAKRVLLRLVSADGTRARRTQEQLAIAGGQNVLDALVRGRLVVAREGDEGVEYELTHEALIQSWSTFRQWIASEAGHAELKERLAGRAAEWKRLRQSNEALLGERQLLEMDVLDAASLSPLETTFIAASRKARLRRRWIRGGIVAVIPIALASAYLGVGCAQRAGLRRRAELHVGESQRLLEEARQQETRALDLRRRAFEQFDRGEWPAAELDWARHRSVEEELDRALGRASQTLEAALKIDPSNDRVTEQFADVLLARAFAAERDHRTAAVEELLERLALYDANGERRKRFHAPARLAVTSSPPSTIRMERLEVDAQGRRRPTETRELGAAEVEVPSGSYLLTLSAPGRATVRYPLVLAREQRLSVAIDLPPASIVPAGFVYVPPGPFLVGSSNEMMRTGFLGTVPLHSATTNAFLIARRETTYREWIEYLKSLPPAERTKRTPRVVQGFHEAMELVELPDGRWKLTIQPAERAYSASIGERIAYGQRDRRREQDWLNFPVSGVSFEDVESYVRWLDHQSRVPGARLCTEFEWERAARGADDREYPHGDTLAPDDANHDATYAKHPLGFGPDEVGSHPASHSPFGVEDMSGNVWEWTRGFDGKQTVLRGGSYHMTPKSARITNREVTDPTVRDAQLGVRICADVPKS